jgi:GNAT superfamily N-acetyltransferase
MPKFYLTCSPGAVPILAAPGGVTIRQLAADPAGAEGAQGAVLRAGYAGSPDPNPGGPDADDGDDAVQFWRGDWGAPIPSATVGAFDGSDRLIGLSYVCLRDDGPLLADVVVVPEMHGRGVGAALISASAGRLSELRHAVFNLAVHPDNIGPFMLYARMGFRFFTEGCHESGSVVYRTEDQFQGVHAQFDSVVPTMNLDVRYCVVPSLRPEGFEQWINRDAQHRLPGRILAALVGHRTGSGHYWLDRTGLEAAVGLLSPAEAATIYEHPNLGSWRQALETGSDSFRVLFGAAVDEA